MAWNRDKPNSPSASAARNAHKLRKLMTDAERRLWTALRREMTELKDTHFRRQMAIGPYVADFVCLGRRLIIEVDGKIHDDRDQRLRDAVRDTYLRGEGFRVMRFSNTDVMLDMPLVLRRIVAAIATPTPSPSPQGVGEPEALP
ncbi:MULTISPECIES: endonuclease domain-containing protein [Rhizobium]|uniref:endonuclease domain-containing protein n=1 Tax=Rhizobium TaxID=379 RepID=UPI000DA916F2|nr:endonuclease domain-containing protein [Rhizobium sp. VS19-DR96]MBZ5767444.1 endonuclease domain-containing protein [Rhizobium sp. VS19-DR129.2]MBZ5775107.1 endonuclease domain-containing protein [Rhizobium sp. VS19-DRK62.2]MBZ5785928.1 endonuclease domain-containing protein [Rhizobium sp. VS19-DR121]MBZ5803354.1 endonuclease domain-containing protein [Rhizobium sp. VS19-DR181]MBZ5819034.1 endonuclease domain-containing protein [Rhizobium sp. VS19-DR183]MBZ5831759.1 endonuclease domain-con